MVSAAAERLERLELSEIYRSNAKRRACLILFILSVEREPSFLGKRIAGIEPIPCIFATDNSLKK